MADPWPYPVVDPTKNQIFTFFGRKGSGKSQAAREHFRAWPGTDRLIIDINGDADPGEDLGAIVLRGPLVQLPPRRDPQVPDTYRWIADPKSPSFREHIDQAIGAALFPRDRKVLLWIDEGGEAFPVNQTGPNGRLLLHQSRHFLCSALICAPRPKGLDPLTYGQSDRVLLFDMAAHRRNHRGERGAAVHGHGRDEPQGQVLVDHVPRRGPRHLPASPVRTDLKGHPRWTPSGLK
jgi:hypothetical protein